MPVSLDALIFFTNLTFHFVFSTSDLKIQENEKIIFALKIKRLQTFFCFAAVIFALIRLNKKGG